MQRRRPPSGYHWCHVGYRERDPNEILLDDDFFNVAASSLATNEATASIAERAHEATTSQNQKETPEALVHALPKALPFSNIEDVLALDPEYFNELEASDPGDYEKELYEETYEEEDDGLGYYPDGVKRTLTDEQIAIFRHTELQMRERHQRRQLEDADADYKMSATEAAYLCFFDRQQPEKNVKAAAKKSDREEVPYDQRHKRKWESFIEHKDPVQGSMTHRRLARELDDKKSMTVDIDYGEEGKSSGTHAQPTQPTVAGRRIVSYADD